MEKIRIFAVDDEEGVLNVIKKVFNDHEEYDLYTGILSQKTAERINNEKFDIYIVNYQIPGINGIELLEVIQEVYNSKGYQYVSIFCTAYGTLHLFHKEFAQGLFVDFLEKPFEIENLKNVVQNAVKKLRIPGTGGASA